MTLVHDTHDNNLDINNSRKFSPEQFRKYSYKPSRLYDDYYCYLD